MNKKGQVLLVFILLIPVFLILLALVVDVGLLYKEKKHLDSSLKAATKYGLKHITDASVKEKVETLILENVGDTSEINVVIEDDAITTSIKENYNGIFKMLFKNNIYEIEISYYGYMDDNNKEVLTKNRGI